MKGYEMTLEKSDSELTNSLNLQDDLDEEICFKLNGVCAERSNGAHNFYLHHPLKEQIESNHGRHLEQNPAPEVQDPATPPRIGRLSEDQRSSICLLQSCFRRKLGRRLWLLDWVIQHRGRLLLWMMKQSGAENVQDQVHAQQDSVSPDPPFYTAPPECSVHQARIPGGDTAKRKPRAVQAVGASCCHRCGSSIRRGHRHRCCCCCGCCGCCCCCYRRRPHHDDRPSRFQPPGRAGGRLSPVGPCRAQARCVIRRGPRPQGRAAPRRHQWRSGSGDGDGCCCCCSGGGGGPIVGGEQRSAAAAGPRARAGRSQSAAPPGKDSRRAVERMGEEGWGRRVRACVWVCARVCGVCARDACVLDF